MSPLLSIRNLAVSIGGKPILRALDFDLPRHGCVALLGPSGTGKSTLLRTLAGLNQSSSMYAVAGEITSGLPEGRMPGISLVRQHVRPTMPRVIDNLVHEWPERAGLSQLEQRARLRAYFDRLQLDGLGEQLLSPVIDLPPAQQRLVAILGGALSGCDLLLIDEPTAELGPEASELLLMAMRQLAKERTILLVTHHLGHAKAVADRVILLANGVVQENSEAQAFFSEPTSRAGKQFIQSGSCPESPEPLPEDFALESLAPAVSPVVAGQPEKNRENRSREIPAVPGEGPNGFHWLFRGQLAGTPRPGLLRNVAGDLTALRDAGVDRLVSLTEEPFDAALAAQYGMKIHPVPIRDMGVPTLTQVVDLCAFIDHELAVGGCIAVHCKAGLGRTGTILAAYLLWKGQGRLTGQQALTRVRTVEGGWVQSEAQIAFLDDFANFVRENVAFT